MRGRYYLYLQRSLYKDKKRSTEHVKYIGPEENFTADDIVAIIQKQEQLEVGKNENKRIKGK